MIYGYIRVSTDKQTIEGQKNLISRWAQDRGLVVQWIEKEISSRKTLEQRGITEMVDSLQAADTIIVTELSRLGRSTKEVLGIVDNIVKDKGCRLITLNPPLDIDGTNIDSPMNNLIITMFAAIAKMERDFISERTKQGLRAVEAKGIKLGKPAGGVQRCLYDRDHDKIKHLVEMGVPTNTIIETHLKYGKYLSLSNYIKRLKQGKVRTDYATI